MAVSTKQKSVKTEEPAYHGIVDYSILQIVKWFLTKFGQVAMTDHLLDVYFLHGHRLHGF